MIANNAKHSSIRSSWRVLLILSAVGAGAGLVGAEIFVRLFWTPQHPLQPNLYRYDSDVGLMYIPGDYNLPFQRCTSDSTECTLVDVHFSVNQQGFRSHHNFDMEHGHPMIAVLGDSMIAAKQVDDGKTACEVLERNLRRYYPAAEVRNYGITSAGLVHYYARWHKFVREATPDLVVLVVFGFNDFRNCSTELENFLAVRPHYALLSNGQETVRFRSPEISRSGFSGFIASVYEQLELHRFLEWFRTVRAESPKEGGYKAFSDLHIYDRHLKAEYQKAVETGIRYLGRLIDEARQQEIPVLVVYLPWSGEVVDSQWKEYSSIPLIRDQAEEFVRSGIETAGVSYHSFTKDIKDLPENQKKKLWHVKTDSHLTEYGNQILGDSLTKAILPIMH